ncbi:MAG: ABC transporter ATP-binding protein [Roseburia sp.]|uniref:ABC transporter ATP-binding protein n=1 Tax=Roseburia hominis TaxID=301301 RepID=UPI003EFA0C12
MGVREKGWLQDMEEKENLKINHVKKIFKINETQLEVLTDINLDIKAGEFISIVGASGCGKSTLARMIAGLEKPTAGDITIGEKKIEKPSVNVGMVFQESRLFPWLTVEKNVEFGIHENLTSKEKKELVQKHIELVGLKSFEKALPKQLSGGMQQRVSIARALINNPSVLILDEPFGALDALTRINMQNEVLKIWEQERTTMILITHDIDEAIFLSDRILIMGKNPGEIKKEIKVGMSRPRSRNSYGFTDIRKEIYQEFFENTDMDIEYYL